MTIQQYKELCIKRINGRIYSEHELKHVEDEAMYRAENIGLIQAKTILEDVFKGLVICTPPPPPQSRI